MYNSQVIFHKGMGGLFLERVYIGKTKDVYKLDNGDFLLQFKDDVTGTDGVFDPGSNTVGLSIEGAGKAGLAMSAHFFELLKDKGIDTHYLGSDLEKATMTVKAASVFGKGLEVICRYKAVGSFIRRYGDYMASGTDLPAYVEMTLKDDDRGDPLVTKDGLEVLGVLETGEYELIVAKCREICGAIKDHLASKGLELYDIKLEFGRIPGGVILIDEISGGNMRVFTGERAVEPLELSALVLA